MRHYVKNSTGAALRFSFAGYSSFALRRLGEHIATDAGLSAPARAKARALMDQTDAWTRMPMGQSPEPCDIGLFIASKAEKTSDRSLAVDGHMMMAHQVMAAAFHKERPWLNALATERGWTFSDGSPLRLDPIFSHGLTLSKDIRLEDADPASLMGSGIAYAIYCSDHGGYVDAGSNSAYERSAPLSRAKLFESSAQARQFASRKSLNPYAAIVEISARATRVLVYAESGNHDALLGAIARAEAAELSELLKAREIDDLRATIARLEAERAMAGATPEPTAKKGRL